MRMKTIFKLGFYFIRLVVYVVILALLVMLARYSTGIAIGFAVTTGWVANTYARWIDRKAKTLPEEP